MKSLLLLGGVIGFLIGISFGLIGDRPLPQVLVQACLTTYAACWLMRWWGRVWIRGLKESKEMERRNG